ncbi:hypothetical protein V9L05_18320 [Bernardetia sp. Wsw4-3y2]|uniref:hypothetical protein n=1 Tax=Bernardetia sp. Wsw4-3y2 TaxID=3127471 RepID=UPI0030CCDD43
MIFNELYDHVNELNNESYKSEYAIITNKEVETKEHGGARGGASSTTTYVINYKTRLGKISNIVYGGNNWEYFNEGDSISINYYEGKWDKYHKIQKIE